jgi:hypothetical protein
VHIHYLLGCTTALEAGREGGEAARQGPSLPLSRWWKLRQRRLKVTEQTQSHSKSVIEHTRIPDC